VVVAKVVVTVVLVIRQAHHQAKVITVGQEAAQLLLSVAVAVAVHRIRGLMALALMAVTGVLEQHPQLQALL
jgi:hypothetical protein